MELKRKSDPIAEVSGKFPHVGTPDVGVQPHECTKLYLVSRAEEVGSSGILVPVGLHSWKMYGYQGLKVAIWVNAVTFHAFADVSFESKSDRGNGITDVKAYFKRIFADNLVDEKEEFRNTFAINNDFLESVVSNGRILEPNASNGPEGAPADLAVLQVAFEDGLAIHKRLLPLTYLITGGKPTAIYNDLLILLGKDVSKVGEGKKNKKDVNLVEDGQEKLFGYAAAIRIGRRDSCHFCVREMFVLPPHQQKIRFLLEALNSYAISQGEIYDMLFDEPIETLQHIRTCIDVHRLLVFKPIQPELQAMALCLKQGHPLNEKQRCQFGPPARVAQEARQKLKINMKQFSDCWEILLYLQLHPIDEYMESFRTIVSCRVKALNFASKFLDDMPENLEDRPPIFDWHKKKQTCIESVEEQLNRLVDERMRKIKLVADECLSEWKTCSALDAMRLCY